MSRKAFTLIELVTTMVILGLLTSIATPMYLDYRADAKRSAERAVVAAVQTAIYNKYAKDQIQGGATWPTTLDSAAAGSQVSATNPFFTAALSTPVTSDWKKGSTTKIYIGPANTTYYYNSSTGRFSTTPTGPTPPPVSPVI
jgi:prepilin-type N-terminal cleavage/methylation domain-containing protein